MRNCNNCHSKVPEGAQFCPECGAKQAVVGVTCTHCGGLNPRDADFCIHCGGGLDATVVEDSNTSFDVSNYKVKYPLDFGESVRLPIQLRTYFLKFIKERLVAEGNGQYFDEYVNRFLDSPFLKTFDHKAMEMAEQSYLLHSDQSVDANWQVDQYLTKQFEKMRKAFMNTEEIGDKVNSQTEELIHYEKPLLPTLELGNLIHGSLNLAEEPEKWYHDLSTMPRLKLQNAKDYFLFPEEMEHVFLICDQTIFGSCREGFALTDKALYWKAHFNKAQQINYKDIESLELSEEWLVINGQFFNANPAINVKMMHLLKKLKALN